MRVPTICRELFEHLSPLHGLGTHDREVLEVAANAFFSDSIDPRQRSAARPPHPSHWPLVNVTLQLASETLPHAGHPAWTQLTHDESRRALWLAALLRLAHSVDMPGAVSPSVAYALWTDDIVYLEFTLPGVTGEQLRSVAHTTALEIVTDRRVILAAAVPSASVSRFPSDALVAVG